MTTKHHRKIWVKRARGSPTLIVVGQDDLVDDVRGLILRKYYNSLGQTYDAPDMVLLVVARRVPGTAQHDRILGPEESICPVIDLYYPGGQMVQEALVIEIPEQSAQDIPPIAQYDYPQIDSQQYQDADEHDYFSPQPAFIQPVLSRSASRPLSRPRRPSIGSTDYPRSLTVLNTGQVPPLPSPGGRRHRFEREHRLNRSHVGSQRANHAGAFPAPLARPSPLPAGLLHPLRTHSTPPKPSSTVGETAPTQSTVQPLSENIVPTRSTSDDRRSRSRRTTPPTTKPDQMKPSNVLDDSVPPINVLIVEDNTISSRVLQKRLTRLKVRWQTATNGQIAVDKWKAGGFHLVLMDIQMPVMDGLEATKEIRRLERLNHIGVSVRNTPGVVEAERNGSETVGETETGVKDDLLDKAEGMFMSPVIIVALTASSLQADRNEALNAGCNDFLTKPVSDHWLQRKVKEWGCMQALIDFGGWRKWKDFEASES